MAALWKLPVVYGDRREQNANAMGTSVSRRCGRRRIFSRRRGLSFNIPGDSVDGMDIPAVKEAGRAAIELARSGEGGPSSSKC